MNKPTLKRTFELKLPTGVLAADLSPDDKFLVAGCMDGVHRVELSSRKDEKLYEHGSYVSSAAWVNDDLILSAGYDGAVNWYSVGQNKVTRTAKLHDFWSWDMAVSRDRKLFASVTGQYLAGGYKYEPLPEREPSLKVVSVATGEIVHELPHVPSVQAVAFSPDNRFVAAGNLMGEVRVFETESGKLAKQWTTPDFTSWGIIKSHCYLGGIFAMQFAPDGEDLLLAGMGPMRDPMAGNGRQLWQKWSWNQTSPQEVGETLKGESGEGLMETLAVHPSGNHFVMGGRLRGGKWNVAMFELPSGKKVAELKTGYRVTQACFSASGGELVLVGTQGQPRSKKPGDFPRFGRVEMWDLEFTT